MTTPLNTALDDLARIRQELVWLEQNLADCHMIAQSKPWQPGDRVQSGTRTVHLTGPVPGHLLAERTTPQQATRNADRAIKDIAGRLVKCRGDLEHFVLNADKPRTTMIDTPPAACVTCKGDLDCRGSECEACRRYRRRNGTPRDISQTVGARKAEHRRLLDAAGRRREHAGDPRWGEWEPSPVLDQPKPVA